MIELLNKYPKAAKLVKEYYLEQLMKGLKQDLPEEFKEHVREMGVDDEKIAKLIEVNPSTLFSFFDSKNVLITIHADLDPVAGFDPLFRYSINNGDKSNYLKSRLEIEQFAVKDAFSILELKLS